MSSCILQCTHLDDVDKWDRETADDAGENAGEVHVLIGHSAHPVLRHDKYLKEFEKYKEGVILHLPLLYGVAKYADKIEKKALEMYGERHVRIYRDMMDQEEYFKMLKQVDVAVFDYEHQMAFGNIVILLYLNKKIYLLPSGVMYKELKSLGLQVYDVNEISKVPSLAQIRQVQPNYPSCDGFAENHKYATRKLDKNILVNEWDEMFKSIQGGDLGL